MTVSTTSHGNRIGWRKNIDTLGISECGTMVRIPALDFGGSILAGERLLQSDPKNVNEI